MTFAASKLSTGSSIKHVHSISDLLTWLQNNASRIGFFIVVLIIAYITVKVASSALYAALDKSNIPSASIFVNIAKVLIWFVALMLVMKPVFGIDPTTLVTAVGSGGLAISLGMQDTISNVIGGFGLMAGKVVQPGDIVTVSGSTGVVQDLTWRHTIVKERGGNELWIPNSALNTVALEKLPYNNSALVKVHFVTRGNADLDYVEQQILTAIAQAAQGFMPTETQPLVRFSGFTAYGVEGDVLLFAAEGVQLSTVADKATRALAGCDFLVQDAAGSTAPSTAHLQ